MERIEIIEKLKEILKMTMYNSDKLIDNLKESDNLYFDLGLSSVGMLYIVLAIEDTFKIDFDDVSFGDFNIVKDVIDYIESKTKK